MGGARNPDRKGYRDTAEAAGWCWSAFQQTKSRGGKPTRRGRKWCGPQTGRSESGNQHQHFSSSSSSSSQEGEQCFGHRRQATKKAYRESKLRELVGGRAIDSGTISVEKDHEASLHEAEEAFAALQVLDEECEEGEEKLTTRITNNQKVDDDDELLRSLEDIEPQQFSAIVEEDNDDSLALLSSDLMGLFSNDPDSPSIVSDDNQKTEAARADLLGARETVQDEDEAPHIVLADSAASNTTTTNTGTTLAVDSLPEIEIDFGEDPFLIDSDKLHSIFDVVEQDTESREENDIGSQDEEGKRERLDFGNSAAADIIEAQSPFLATLVENRQQQLQGPNNNNDDDEGDLLQHPIVEEFPVDIDLETEELYNELAKMSLKEQNADPNTAGITEESKSTSTIEQDENLPSNNEGDNVTGADPKTTAKAKKSKAERKKAALDDLLGFDSDPKATAKAKKSKAERKKAALDDLLGFDSDPKATAKAEQKEAEQMEDSTGGDDGLSPYFFCQPCSEEDYSTMAGTEDEIVERDREQHTRDLKALYAASAVSRDDLPPLDYSDPLLRELQAQYEYEQYVAQQMHYEHQQQQLAEQMEYERQQQEAYDKIWSVAKHWAKAFAVDLDEAVVDISGERKATPSKDTSKTGFGCKETIFGISFSDDGKYLATACQDANIGIWDVARNKLVKSLKEHDKNYECLRVDWSSRLWAQDVLDRSNSFANLIASAGADGTVKIWACANKKDGEVGHPEPDNEWICQYTLDHANLENMGSQGLEKIVEEEEEEETNEGEEKEGSENKGDKPQVYSLQFIDHWDIFTKNLKDQVCSRHSEQAEKEEEEAKKVNDGFKNSFLMTSSEQFIHLWELEPHSLDNQLKMNDEKIRILQDKIKLKEVMSLHFGPLEEYTYGVTVCSVTGTGMKLPPPPSKKHADENGEIVFGGPRNPENTIFVFDAAYCPGSGLLGVALADGSLRLVNGRGACISVIQVPGSKSHLTSFCWDKSGSRLATCVATGHLITWSLDAESHDRGNYNTVATCTAIFEGGHQSGRPLYGSRFCGGEDENLLLSWGVDGKICMWYSQSQGNIYDPVAVLRDDASYPVYTAAIPPSEQNLVVGGGSDGGFIGVPLHFYDIPPLENEKSK